MDNIETSVRTLRYVATLGLLACSSNAASAHGSHDPSAHVIQEWNTIALATTAAAPFNPSLESRNVAIVHAAMFDAVNSITHEFRHYAVNVRASEWASTEAAAAAAAHLALVQLYAAQKEALDAAYAKSLLTVPNGRAKGEGIDVGEKVATQLLAVRANDGAARALTVPYDAGTEIGAWRPTPPAFLNALAPGWGSVTPFVLKAASQFRPGPPPAVDSRRYTRDFEEIREIGSIASATRTQEETDLARAWIATGPQNWNRIARQVALARGLDLEETAHLFALLNLAGADAFIASWDSKYFYGQWRPVTAIRAVDNNPRTIEDPTWTPLLPTPPFPDYIAGHTVYAGAASKVLGELLGDCPGVDIELRSATAPNFVRVYTSFEAVADDVVEARILGGIHWRTSSERGQRVGERIGEFTVDHFLTRRHRHDE